MPWRRGKVQTRSQVGPTFTLRDPALAEYLGIGGQNDAGVSVTESTSLGVTAVWRSVSLIAGTVAGLPLKSYRDTDGQLGEQRERVASVFDDPGAPMFTPFEFVHLTMVHLLLHGNAYLLHVYNGAGSLAGFFPIHPGLVSVKWEQDRGKVYTVSLPSGYGGTGPVEYTDDDLLHVMCLSLDGLIGVDPITACRNALGTALAGDKAAARMFSSGMLLGGLVTSNESLTQEQAEALKAGLMSKMSGTNNAGDIAVVNASLTFSPWTMTAENAQFIESRTHQVTEVARMFGVPKVLLAEDGASTWGSGIAELNRGFARYTLRNYTTPLEQRFSRVLASPRFVEFEYKALLAGTPEVEIPLLIQQVQAGLLSTGEARAIMNLPSLSVTESQPLTEGAP